MDTTRYEEVGEFFYGKTPGQSPNLKDLDMALNEVTEQLGSARSLSYKPILAVFTGLFLTQKITGISDNHNEVASYIFRANPSSLDYISEVKDETGATHLNIFQINDVEAAYNAHGFSDDWKAHAMKKLSEHGITSTQLDAGISRAVVINHVQPGRPVVNENGETIYKPQADLSKFFFLKY